MKVLIVARLKNGHYAPFIEEQVDALRRLNVKFSFFPVRRKGLFGYLRHIAELKKRIQTWEPDLIHAHYGFSGVLANLQRDIPVVTTYHGSDINKSKARFISRWAIKESSYNIFVSKKTIEIANPKRRYALIPCGINLEDYPITEKHQARDVMSLDQERKYVLFSGAFDNKVKNAPLAKEAMTLLPDAELLELKGYNRVQVATLMQAVDAILMTSFTEGSPQVIKEALACGCPIVSVDVGDVSEMIEGVDGCFISEAMPEALADNLRKAICFNRRTAGRDVILRKGLTNDLIARRIIAIYKTLS